LLGVLGLIAGWAAVNQLNMLLGLYRQATRDPLTGLANRRQAMEQLSGDMKLMREKSKPLSVLLFDLDKFKSFNDTYGHAAGDIVLQRFAKVMRKFARKRLDLVCRYGGEEFLMVLPGLDAEQAGEVAEKIRLACHDEQVKTPTGERIGFTTSIGVAELKAEDTIDSLLQHSDDALYEAKGTGRDRVHIA
jgi:diguanylate cyclase (GGDEF)-like protein